MTTHTGHVSPHGVCAGATSIKDGLSCVVSTCCVVSALPLTSLHSYWRIVGTIAGMAVAPLVVLTMWWWLHQQPCGAVGCGVHQLASLHVGQLTFRALQLVSGVGGYAVFDYSLA